MDQFVAKARESTLYKSRHTIWCLKLLVDSIIFVLINKPNRSTYVRAKALVDAGGLRYFVADSPTSLRDISVH